VAGAARLGVTHNKASVRFSTNMASEELRSVQAGQEAGAHPTDFSTLFPCPFYHNTTLQHYRLLSVTTTVTKFTFTGPGKACSRIFSLGAKPCMLVSPELNADFSRRRAHLPPQPPSSATHPHSAIQENRSPTAGTPARSGSRPELTWTALYLGVEVNHHPSRARAPLACHPSTTLHIVDTSLKASHAGALLVRTCSRGSHDHAIISSTSWSKRSSTLGLIRPLLVAQRR
jgi:hypothetical protein